jgi:hypothetical protein
MGDSVRSNSPFSINGHETLKYIKEIEMKRFVAGFVLAGIALTAVSAMAQQGGHFSGFGPAQQMIDDTISRVEAMRREGHEEFGGHAEHAETLLRQAKAELNAAADYRMHH